MTNWDEYVRQSAARQGVLGEKYERVLTDGGTVGFSDGDSGVVTGSDGRTTEFRLAGMDAPEVGHPDRDTGVPLAPEIGGHEARAYLAHLLGKNPDAQLTSTGEKDYYGRGDVSEFIAPDGTNLNVELVRSGLVSSSGQDGAAYADASLGATLNTMTEAGDTLTGDARVVNEVARDVHNRAELALNAGEIRNAASGGLMEQYDRVNDHGTVKNAWDRGLHNTSAMLGGFQAAVGDAFGADGMKSDGLEVADRNQTLAGAYPAKVNSWDDVHNFGDGATYALEKTVENLPLIGATAAGALSTGGSSLVGQGTLTAAGARTAAGMLARVGMKHGAAATLYAANTGDSALQLRSEGVDDFGATALTVGVPKTMLDYASLAAMTRGVGQAVSSAARGKGFDPVQAGKEFVANVVREGATEGTQQILDNGAIAGKTGEAFNFDHVADSAIAGAVVGGAFGVAQAAPGAAVSAYNGAKGVITSREAKKDIDAQLNAQSEGVKPATFVSEANADSYADQVAAAGDNATVLRSPEGQLATQRPVSDADRAAYESGTPDERDAVNARHLNYSDTKANIDPATASVVQVKTPAGAVVHEELTNNPEQVVAKLSAGKRPTDVVEVTNAVQAQIRRVEAMGVELSDKVTGAFEHVQRLIAQDAPIAEVHAAENVYKAVAADLERAQQLHAQLSAGTISSPKSNEGAFDGAQAADAASATTNDVRQGDDVLPASAGISNAAPTVSENVGRQLQDARPLPPDGVRDSAGSGTASGGAGVVQSAPSVPDVGIGGADVLPKNASDSGAGAGGLLRQSISGDTARVGELNDQSTRPADDAAGDALDAGAERAGGDAGVTDNGAGPVDSGASENASVARDRAKGPRVAFGRLDAREQRRTFKRLTEDKSFAGAVAKYMREGYSDKDALEFALADEKIAAADIPNDYSPSVDNTLFDETELPSQGAVYSPEDVDAQENIKNYATKAYYGSLLVAHQEAFTARHPTWELVPTPASDKDFFLEPQPRVFASIDEAQAEAARLEPLYYGFIFRTAAHADGRIMLTRHKINAGLSTDAMHPTRSWVHQALPKIKLQARGAESAIRGATGALNSLAKNVANHQGAFYKRRTAELRQVVQDNEDKLIKLSTPDGAVIQVHAPTLTEQGKLLLGEYSTHTTKAEYAFLAFKQALSALATMGYTYDTTQGPSADFFPPELNISPSSTALRVKDIVKTKEALGLAEKAHRISLDELFRLQGLRRMLMSPNTGTSREEALDFADDAPKTPAARGRRSLHTLNVAIEAQRKIVEDLRLTLDNYKSVDPTGKDPYGLDTQATKGAFDGPDSADGRSEVDRFTDNFNRAAEKETRTEAQGFAGDSSGFFDQSKVGASSHGGTVDSGESMPTAGVKNAVAAFLRRYPGAQVSNVKYRIGEPGEKAKYSSASDTLYIYTNNVTDAADLTRTLHHELLVHKGLGLYDTKRITTVFATLKAAITRDAALKDAFATIQNDPYYSKLPEREQLEELLAFIAEGIDTGLVARTFNRVTIALRSVLKTLGVIDSTDVSFSEVEAIVQDIASAYRTGLRRSLRGDQQAAFWRTIAGMDGVFSYGKSSAKNIEDIAADLEGPSGYKAYEDEALALQNEHGATKSWRIDMPDGGKTAVFQVGNRVWIDIHESQMGTGGSRVYNIVANYAYNNGKVFIGDPAGVSPEAMSRRLENMLSSALKFGTTNHIAPHPDQLKGGSGVPALKWVAGDTWRNIAAMLEASYASTRGQIPEVDNYQYDPVTDTITDRGTGKVISDGDLRKLAVRARRESELVGGNNAGGTRGDGSPITAGSRSITRAILGGTFLRSQGRERSELLAALRNVSSKRLEDAFYRLDSAAIQLKFRDLRKSKVGKWGASIRAAGNSFTNLVFTGYEQMKALHPATAQRFKRYQAHKNQMSAYWLGVWHNNIGLSPERVQAAFAELQPFGENANIQRSQVSADAWAVRKYLDEIHASMLKKYSPTMGKIPNYLPQPVDTRAMISDKEGFIQILLRHPMDSRNKNAPTMNPDEANGVFNALLGNSGLDGLTIDELEGAVGVGNKHRHQRVLRNPALIADLEAAGFMFADKREAMEYYITQGVNRSAFERVFGGYRPIPAMLDHNGAINGKLLGDKLSQAGHGDLVKSGLVSAALLQEAVNMGYARMVDGYVHWYSPVSYLHDAREQVRSREPADLRKFDDLTHGMLGFFGDRISSEAKLWQSRIMAGESLLTLAFSAFSSQTDWAGPALRVMQDKGVAAAWAELKAGIRAFSNHKQAQEFATAFGFIVPRQHQSVIRSMAGADHMSAGSQKALDFLFKWNGQALFTDLTRSFAASTGLHYFKTLAADGDTVLDSYGLTPELVTRWIAAGEHAPTQSMERNDKRAFDDAMAVHTALHKFVNESIMRPDSTQRPNWANDPRFALLWHLKSFFWAFWATIMKPTFVSMLNQAKQGNYVEAGAQFAFMGLLLLPLAAVGWELRQLIQYSLFGAAQPSDYMDGTDYVFELASRAGVFGPAQLAFDALGTEDSGRAVARLAGPAADHLYTLIHGEWDEKLYRSIPVLSQLYGAQRAISD